MKLNERVPWHIPVLTLLIMAALMFLGSGAACETARAAHNYFFPCYTQEIIVHTVQNGDTLYGIAQKYAGKQNKWDDLRGIVDDMEHANMRVASGKWLIPGQKINVPLYNKIQ